VKFENEGPIGQSSRLGLGLGSWLSESQKTNSIEKQTWI